MGKEVTYNQINSQLDSLSGQISKSTVTFSWLRGRKFKPENGGDYFTISQMVNKLKKLNQEIKDLQPNYQSNETEFNSYFEIKDKISKLANDIQNKDVKSQDSKIKGFVIRRFFKIPAYIRSKQIESMQKDIKKDIRKLQNNMQEGIHQLQDQAINFRHLYGPGLTEDDIEDLDNREVSKLHGEFATKLVLCREYAVDITDIIDDRKTNPPTTKLIDELPQGFEEIGLSALNRNLENYSDRALETLKEFLIKKGDMAKRTLLEKVGEYEILEEKLNKLKHVYNEHFPPVFHESYSAGFGFTELPKMPPRLSADIPKIDFASYKDQLETNPRLKGVVDKIIKLYDSKEQNPALVFFNLQSPYTQTELDRAARLLSRDCHPDKFPDNHDLAEIIFKEMQRLAFIAKKSVAR